MEVSEFGEESEREIRELRVPDTLVSCSLRPSTHARLKQNEKQPNVFNFKEHLILDALVGEFYAFFLSPL